MVHVERHLAPQFLITEEHREGRIAAPGVGDIDDLAVLEVEPRDAGCPGAAEAARTQLQPTAFHQEPVAARARIRPVTVRVVVGVIGIVLMPVRPDTLDPQQAALMEVNLAARAVVGVPEDRGQGVNLTVDVQPVDGRHRRRPAPVAVPEAVGSQGDFGVMIDDHPSG